MGRKKKENMESLDKRYMLFIFGDFTENETFINDISYQLVTIISSEYLKFNYGEFGMTLHFRTKESFEDLKEYVDMCLEDLVEQYFLMEATENVDIKMDRKLIPLKSLLSWNSQYSLILPQRYGRYISYLLKV